MRVSLVLAALLCFTMWTSMPPATHGQVASCCNWASARVPNAEIVGYTIQTEGVCPLRAIIFHTKSGKSICYQPNTDWARRAIQRVDEENNRKALQEDGLTMDI